VDTEGSGLVCWLLHGSPSELGVVCTGCLSLRVLGSSLPDAECACLRLQTSPKPSGLSRSCPVLGGGLTGGFKRSMQKTRRIAPMVS
jgi:hypothetical protein